MKNNFLTPVCTMKGEPMYDIKDLRMSVVKLIKSGMYFKNDSKGRKMRDDIIAAAESLEDADKIMNEKLNKYTATQRRIAETTNTISRSLRESTQKMHEGLLRIEKQANFDNLERYVTLLERADKAISSLAELESAGKLNKISQALK